MAKKEVKEHFEGLTVVPKKFVKKLERIKKATKKINFRCNGSNCDDAWDTKKRCCKECESHFGYFGKFEIISTSPKYYIKRFDEKDGFWRSGIGCILPRKKRSYICLKYCCRDLDKKNERKLCKFFYKLRKIEDEVKECQ